MKVFIEAVVVGVLTVTVGVVVGFALSKSFSTNLPAICKTWNKNHVMEISLFLTGFSLHLLCEFMGVNKWYCKHGNACGR